MDTFTCIRTRREVRDYLDKPIPNDSLERILEAGRLAPSSKNSQPGHFIVIRDRTTLQKISQLTPTGAHIAKAALAIAILMDAAKLPEIDGARAVQNMVLTAWAMGIGSGYPTEPKAKGKKIRKPLNEIVHSESLGQPFSTSKS